MVVDGFVTIGNVILNVVAVVPIIRYRNIGLSLIIIDCVAFVAGVYVVK